MKVLQQILLLAVASLSCIPQNAIAKSVTLTCPDSLDVKKFKKSVKYIKANNWYGVEQQEGGTRLKLVVNYLYLGTIWNFYREHERAVTVTSPNYKLISVAFTGLDTHSPSHPGCRYDFTFSGLSFREGTKVDDVILRPKKPYDYSDCKAAGPRTIQCQTND